MTSASVRQRKFEKAFDVFDAKHSGYITREGLSTFAENMVRQFGHVVGSAPADTFLQACEKMWQKLQKLDKDHDQRISRDEYIQYLLKASPKDIDDLVRPYIDGIFKLADDNKDDRLDRKEFAEHQRAAGLSESDIRGFEKLDVDGDGYLSKEEYRAYMREFFLSDDPKAKGNELIGGI